MYNTIYYVSVKRIDEPDNQPWSSIEESEFAPIHSRLLELRPYFKQGNEDTWYDHPQHMGQLSREFPLHRFKLEGWGDEQMDIWLSFWFQGKGSVYHHPQWERPLAPETGWDGLEMEPPPHQEDREPPPVSQIPDRIAALRNPGEVIQRLVDTLYLSNEDRYTPTPNLQPPDLEQIQTILADYGLVPTREELKE